MKKIILIFGSLLLMFVLIGCDENGSFTLPTDVTLPTGDITTDGVTTETPTTIDGTTGMPTTQAPTTQAPTTVDGATTEVPTTQVPTTQAPTTQVPTTQVPTTTEEVDTEPVVLLDNPVNLSIDGQVLSWDVVPDAVGYRVYVDGNFQAEVTTNEYDFSSVMATYIVFNVRALALASQSDSNLSLDLVYNVDATSDILAMVTFLNTSNMSTSDNQAFATDLVSRGMTVSNMQTMMTNMEPVMTKMQNPSTTLTQIYPDLDAFLAGMVNIEALVSAFVRVELPAMIQSEIDDLNSMDGTCRFENEYYDETSGGVITECFEYYDYTEDLVYLNRLLTYVETYPDQTIQSVMVVIDYMMRVQDTITPAWIVDVDSLIQTPPTSQFNVNLGISVKNGLINNFKDEMPSLEELTLFNQTIMTFANTMLDDDRMDSFIQAEKTAIQMKLTMELFFDVLLQVDADYVNGMMLSFENEDMAEIIILQLDFINTYIDAHEVELSALNNVYTPEEKEAIFFDLMIASVLEMQGFDETEQADILAIIKENIDFTNLLALQALAGDTLNSLLDEIIDSDYAIIDALNQMRLSSENGFYLENDDYEMDTNFFISADLEPGQYVVTVRGFSSSETGTYDFYVTADYGLGVGDEVIIASMSETLTAGGLNQYTFTLTESAIVKTHTNGSLDTVGVLKEYKEGQVTETEAIVELLNAFLTTVNPVVQDMTDAEYTLFIDTVVSVFNTVIYVQDYTYPMLPEQLATIEQVLDIISTTSPQQFAVLQTFMNQVVVTDYVNQMNLAIDSQDMAELIVIQLDFINNFIDASAVQLDALGDAYTAQEKEDIFFDLIIANFLKTQGLDETEQADIMAIIQTNIDFTNLLALQSLTAESFNDLLDRLDETEYAVIYAFGDVMDLENTRSEMWNEADWEQYDIDKTEAIFDFINSFVTTISPLVEDMTDVEYTLFIDNVLSVLKTAVYIDNYSYPMLPEDAAKAELFFDTISNTTSEQFFILKTLMFDVPVDILARLEVTQYELIYAFQDLMDVENTYYDDWNQYDLDHAEAMASLLDSFVNTMNPLVQEMTAVEYSLFIDNVISIFTTALDNEDFSLTLLATADELAAIELVLDTISSISPEQFTILQTLMNQIDLSDVIMEIYDIYYVDPLLLDPVHHDYGALIVFANVYVDTYDLVETDIDSLLADVLLLLDNTVIQNMLGITSADAITLSTLMSAYPGDLYTQALVVVGYDYTTLTSAQIQELEDLMFLIQTPYASQNPLPV